MTRKRGEIEEWVRRVFFGGDRDRYIIFVRYREEGEENLVPIPASIISDVRRGYIIIGDTMIPFHRVVEIRDSDGRLLYRRSKKRL